MLDHKRPILLALSGGSDSTALLHLILELNPEQLVFAATVDHQLRAESHDEAQSVSVRCKELGVPHEILVWQHSKTISSSQNARVARYQLLVDHARSLGVADILTGHTLDDQAETIVMRALRARQDTETRGLSGIPPISHIDEIRLHRPLLSRTRVSLRTYLTNKKIDWIDDPSNCDTRYERVRIRKSLATANTTPTASEISRLASLSARHRHWLNLQIAPLITQHVKPINGQLHLTRCANLPDTFLRELFSILILVAGGLEHRTPPSRFARAIEAIRQSAGYRCNCGRVLISVNSRTVKFEREARNLPPPPEQSHSGKLWDNRFRIVLSGETIRLDPYIKALETFRPECDTPVRNAIMQVLPVHSCDGDSA